MSLCRSVRISNVGPNKAKEFDAWISQNSAMSNVIDNIVFRLQINSQPPMSTAELRRFLLREFATIARKLDDDFREFNSEYSRLDKKDTQSNE